MITNERGNIVEVNGGSKKQKELTLGSNQSQFCSMGLLD